MGTDADDYRMMNRFAPLDDLFDLLKSLEAYFDTEIDGSDFKVGKEQLTYIFLHEAIHAFIGRKVQWLWTLDEDRLDFIDEVCCRILIDTYLAETDYVDKVRLFYDNHVNHRKEITYYGFDFSPQDYDRAAEEYRLKFAASRNVEGFCAYLRDLYEKRGLKRRDGFSYKMND